MITLQTSSNSFLKGAGGILLAIFIFGFLIFIHELGHFIAAKKANVKVNEFAIGMGPALFKKKVGETTYCLRVLPFGGFVAMEGEYEAEEDESAVVKMIVESDEPKEKESTSLPFDSVSIPKRATIMVSGALMNLVFGLVLGTILTFVQASAPDVAFRTTTVNNFAETAVTNQWLESGDTILRLNNKKIKNFNDFSLYLIRDEDGLVDLTVQRNGEEVLLQNVQFSQNEVEEGMVLNVLDFEMIAEKPTFLSTLQQSWYRTTSTSKMIITSLGDLLTGRVSADQLSGPIGITQQLSEVSQARDWSTLIMFVVMLSLNLGILNLLPFPALDGGRLVLLLIEAIRGKAIDKKYEVYINLAGMAVLFGLMIFVSFKDVIGLFK